MASQSQILANQANAQHSTGPATAAGKARSSRNNTRHGLTLGVLVLSKEERAVMSRREQEFRQEINPVGLLETELFHQFLEGVARLSRVRALIGAMIVEHGEDPELVPACEAELRQLVRYRAAAEMLIYRSIKALRDLQTTRLYRAFHLTAEEAEVIPPLVRPGVKMMLAGQMLGHNDRELFYHIYVAPPIDGRLPQLPPRGPGGGHSVNSNPIRN